MTNPTTDRRPDAWQIASARRRSWVRRVLGHPDLTASQKTVLVALETFANYSDGARARPGEVNLAEMCGLTTRAVRSAIKLARALGLIERSAPANSKLGLAAVYRLVPDPAEDGQDRNGGAGPEVYDRNGGAGPEVYDRNGGAGPEVYDRNGGAGPEVYDRNGDAGGDATTGTAVPPTRELHTPGVLRNWGTSPEPLDPLTHHPSRFCDNHPQGTRNPCRDCANARTAFEAWQSDAVANDIAIAQADDIARQRRRRVIDNCPDCDDFGRLDDLSPCEHPGQLLAVGHA